MGRSFLFGSLFSALLLGSPAFSVDMHTAERQSKEANASQGGLSTEAGYYRTLEKLNACLEEKAKLLEEQAKGLRSSRKTPFTVMSRAVTGWNYSYTNEYNLSLARRNCAARLQAACLGSVTNLQYESGEKRESAIDQICAGLCTPD